MLKKVIMSDLGEIYTGNTPSKKNNEYYESNDIMFIKPDLMSFDIENIEESNEYISEKARDKARIVPANSLLVSCIGNIGKLAINKEEASFNQQINAIVHNENIVSSKYLAYLLKYNQKRLEAIANAPVVPIINKTQFSNFEVLIHESLDSQKKIVEVLDKAQELIDKRKEQIDALDELVKSRFIEMFGDPVINQKQWKKEELGKVCDVRDGTHDSPQYVSDGYPLITSKNISNGVINFEDVNFISKEDLESINRRSKVDNGDIIMPMIGTIGNPVIVNTSKDFAIKNVALIKFNEKTLVTNIFIKSLLESHYFEVAISQNKRGGTQKFIALGDIRKLNVILPPIELQNQFADFANQVDKLKSQMETSLKELEDNFNSLMQKAFKGELF